MKLIYNIGINDLKGEASSKFYQTWYNLLQRCYSEVYQKNKPTYIGCSVCEDWLTFSKFKAWMETQDWEGKQLDKDILFPGNKVYSPETCVFVSREINNFLTEGKSSKGLYPIGVSFDRSSNKFRSQCTINAIPTHLGSFDTPEEAHIAWKSKKLALALQIASKQSDSRTAQALIERYQV